MKQDIRKIIKQVIEKHYPMQKDVGFVVDQTEEKFGDYSTNAAMKIGREVGEKPEEVAKKLIDILKSDGMFDSVTVAGPGFINFKIALPFYQKQILEVIEAGEKYGSSNIGKDSKIDVEFISANPTGPLTIGNSRGGVIGDVLSNVLSKSGYQITREYYFNDAGGQIDVLGHSVLKDAEAQYKGDYIDELHREIKTDDYKKAGIEAAAKLIKNIKKTTEEMGIKFDVWFAEGKDLREKGKVEEILKWLKDKDLTYEKENAVWFKSTTFGDDKDRVLVRSNGEPTYFCVDCAYHYNKFIERKFNKAINIWGADHHGDVSRVRGFVTALGYNENFEIIINQFVRVVVDGKEVRMSKRAGNYVLVKDLLDEVGKDVYRFFILEYAPTSHVNFDLALAKEQSEKNPVYYVQYAYARIHSILKKVQSTKLKVQNPEELLSTLNHPAEITLIKQLIKLPEIIEDITNDYQVQKLPFYARDIAKSFHAFYENCPVIQTDEKTQNARLLLLEAAKIVLKNSLDLMGINAPDKM